MGNNPRMAITRSAPGDDWSFGPRYGNDIDVTLTFSNIVFSIVPSCLLLLAAAVRIRHYHKQPIVAVRSPILWARMTSAICIVGFSIASSVSWCINSAYRTPTTIPSAILFSVAAGTLLIMIWVEHSKSMQPSFTVSSYVIVSMLLDATRARTFTMRPGLEATGALIGVVAAFKFTLMLLLEVRTRLVPQVEAQNIVEELTGGFLNRTVMAWVNALLLTGFRRNLRMDDLKNLDETYSARYLDQQFSKIWDKKPRNRRTLIRILIHMFGAEIVISCAPHAGYIACDFALVYLIKVILNYIDSPELSDCFTPGGLIAANTLIFLGFTITKNARTTITNRVAVRVRSTIFSQITKKVMRLPISKVDKSTALTHISADVEGIIAPIDLLPPTFVAPFYLAVGLYVLYENIGKAAALIVPPTVLFIAATTLLTHFVPRAQKRWNGGIDARVSCSTTVLSQLRTIKIIGLAPSMGKHLQSLREAEVELSMRRRACLAVSWVCTPISLFGNPLVMVAGLMFWTKQQDVLDAAVIFPVFLFAGLVADALNENRRSWPLIASMFASASRIEDFLLQDERDDPRTLHDSNSEKSEPVAISAGNVSVVGRDDHSHSVLSDITFKVATSSFTVLVGPVGSGKSVFLKMLLGETSLASGTIQVNTGSVAYCGQSPWIPRGTARDAIIAESPFEEQWYQTVIKACALQHDFASLPDGDKSPTGTNGSSLSGGQIRRLGLARAVYSKASLLLCDDVLSALDKTTGAHISQELFGSGGLLRQQNRTVVLATHSIEQLDDADQILLFNEGSIKECSRAEIMTNPQQVILARGARDEDIDENETAPVSDKPRDPEPWEAPRMSTDWSIYKFFLGPVPWYILWPSLIGIALIGFMEKFPDLYIRIWLAVGPANKRLFIGMASVFGLSFVVNGVATYLFLIRSIRITSTTIHQRFVDKIMTATLPFITSTNTGALLNKFSQDMTLIAQQMPNQLLIVLYVFEMVAQQTVLIAAGAQYAGLMMPIVLIVLYYIQLFYLQSSRQMRLLDLESQTPLYTKITESTDGLEYIRAFGWEKGVLDKIYQSTDVAAKPFYYMYTIQRWLLLVLNGLGLAMSLILVSIAVFLTKTTSQASLGLALLSLSNYGAAVEALVVCWTGLETSLGAVRRIKAFVEDTPSEVDKPGALLPPPSWPNKGLVVLNGVSCAYSNEEKPHFALENITFTIEPGQKAIVVGRTGSGKSSLLLTLLNCLHHTGSVCIDGIDITDITHDGLREAITTISQEAINLPGSVRVNLVPDRLNSNGVEEQEIWSVLELVRLRNHIAQNGGLDAMMSDMPLSMGQKQLMGAARAILHQRYTKGKLVLMDEVTSNMDYETDKIIQQVMDVAFANCTRIIVSHRQSSGAKYDIVISLEGGRLTAVETWEERNKVAT